MPVHHSIVVVAATIVAIAGTSALAADSNSAKNDLILNHSRTDVGDFESTPPSGSSRQAAPLMEANASHNMSHAERLTRQAQAAYLFSQGLTKQANHDLWGAIVEYRAAIATDDSDPAIHWYLGSAYRSLGKIDEAERQLAIEKEMRARLRAGEDPRPGPERSEPTKEETKSTLDDFGYAQGYFGSSVRRFVPGSGFTKKRVKRP